MSLIILILLSMFCLMWYSYTSKSIPFNCYIFVLIYGFSAALGVVWTLFLGLDTLPFGVGAGVNTGDHVEALLAFLLAMLGYLAGFKTLHRQEPPRHFVTNVNRRKSYRVTGAAGTLFIHLSLLISAIAFYASYPDGGLYSRSEYLPNDINRTLKSASQIMIFISVLLLMTKKGHKISKIIWVIIIGCLFIGSASRSVLLVSAGYVFAKISRNELTLKNSAVISIITIFAIVLVVDFRGQSPHGLAHYSLFEIDHGSLEAVTYVVNYLSSFSYGLTATLVSEIAYTESFFWIAVDPRPGFMTAWPNISELTRLNRFAPYNAISELYCMGAHYLILYFYLAGVISGLSTSASHRNHFFKIIITSVIFLFIIFSLQYNLRPATRYIYLELALCVAFFGWNNVRLVTLLPRKHDEFLKKGMG